MKKASPLFRIVVGLVMVLLGLLSLFAGFYMRFVLEWKGSGAFSLVNTLLGILIVTRGAQYLRS